MTRNEVLKALLDNTKLYYYVVDKDFKIKIVPKIKEIDLNFGSIRFNEYEKETRIRFELLFTSKESLAQHIKDILYVSVGGER